MARLYSENQLSLLRKALQDYRNLGIQDGGRAFSWASIAEAICEKTGAKLSHKNLAKFADGVPHPDPDKKKQGLRRYTKQLEHNGLDHILAFLTDTDEEWSCMTQEEFDAGQITPRWPASLTAYLRKGCEQEPLINLDCFIGDYARVDDHQQSWHLHLKQSTNPAILEFSMLAQPLEDHKPESPLSYQGWGVISPEDQVLLIGKDNNSGENLIYQCVGFDNTLRQGKPPNFLALQEQTLPEDRIEIVNKDTKDLFLRALQEETHANIHLFHLPENRIELDGDVDE